MSDKSQLIKSAVAGLLALTATGSMAATVSATAMPQAEKCYGIVKAGMNDCQTSKTACAGSATKDRQADAFLFLPKGACEKIVGGSLTPGKPDDKK